MKVHVRQKHMGEAKKDCPIPGCKKDFTTIGNMKVSCAIKIVPQPTMITDHSPLLPQVHIHNHHEPELKIYEEIMNDQSKPIPEEVATLWAALLRIYKNSNCGIKGRGVEDPKMKELDKIYKENLQRRSNSEKAQQAQIMPLSPEVSPMAGDDYQSQLRLLDYQNKQRLYEARLYDGRQEQHHPSEYMQHLPVQQSQPIFHGLPTPTPYTNMNMGWSSAPFGVSPVESHRAL